ncbi:MAG: membrane protein insertion efficiency factor YidD [Actinomycetia bacterium]|nr:membrane protein insertion efficiency factor YidD [Actinomycetes bacterium]
MQDYPEKKKKNTSVLNKSFIFLIRVYQKILSPIVSRNSCRFYPTCSNYAIDALRILPLYKAIFKIIFRILKCNPFHPGGYDPVEKKELKNG